jgi:hypothetical protein
LVTYEICDSVGVKIRVYGFGDYSGRSDFGDAKEIKIGGIRYQPHSISSVGGDASIVHY